MPIYWHKGLIFNLLLQIIFTHTTDILDGVSIWLWFGSSIFCRVFNSGRPRQGLTRLARKDAGGRCCAARRRPWEPPQPANSPPGNRGQARKARLPPNLSYLSKIWVYPFKNQAFTPGVKAFR